MFEPLLGPKTHRVGQFGGPMAITPLPQAKLGGTPTRTSLLAAEEWDSWSGGVFLLLLPRMISYVFVTLAYDFMWFKAKPHPKWALQEVSASMACAARHREQGPHHRLESRRRV